MEHDEALKQQFAREVRIGIALIGVTLSAFLVVAFVKLRGTVSEVDESATTQISPATTTALPAFTQNRKSNAAALQAATASMLDQVDPSVGGPSPTKSPPMPAPRAFLMPMEPAPKSHEAIIPTSDSSMQVASGEPFASNHSNFPLKGIANNSSTHMQVSATEGVGEANALTQNTPSQTLPLPNAPPMFPVRRADPKTTSIKAESNDDLGAVLQVNAGDSLWTIAQRHYGDGRMFRALAAFNRLDQTETGRPVVGSVLQLPSPMTLRKSFPELVPEDLFSATKEVTDPDEGAYITQPGDTLFVIARNRLGQASRYVEIIDRNTDSLPENVSAMTKLPIGIRLTLSEK